MLLRLLIAAMVLWLPLVAAADVPAVKTLRVPGGGVQPQVAVGEKGVIHLIYYKGDEKAGDIFYVRSGDGGATFSEPLRVNGEDGRAISIGTVRGAHLAIGKAGRPHVAWMGGDGARPTPPGTKATPMLYTRLNDAGTAFEPARNVIQQHVGLDGGGSIAADRQGGVFVAWHAPSKRDGNEADRRVWMVWSDDEGKTFKDELPISPKDTGVCGCCGMRLFSDGGENIYALYRSATDSVHRDIYLLTTRKRFSFAAEKVGPWNVGTCVMSTAAFAPASGGGALAAWEQEGQIYFTRVSSEARTTGFVAAPGRAGNRKHPAIAADSKGNILLAWAEGTGWQKGGTVAWQLFDSDGKPVANSAGRAKDLPVWSMPAVFLDAEGVFVVMH